MKKFVNGLLVLAALIAVIAVAVVYFPELLTPTGDDTSTHDSDSDSGDDTGAPEQQDVAVLARPTGATLSHVAYIHDGDTLYLQPDGTSSRDAQVKVRLIGVDAPELRPEPECFGFEARDYLRGMLPEGTAVWIMPDREAVDQYGRSLLYLWTQDDRSVNLSLVANGYATALNIAPSNTYAKQFDRAESAARDADNGFWGSC